MPPKRLRRESSTSSLTTGSLDFAKRLPRRDFIKCIATTAAVASPLADRVWGLPQNTSATRMNASEKAILALYQTLSDTQKRAICFDWDFRVDIKYGRKPLWIPDPNGILLRSHLSNAWLITSNLIGSSFYTDEQRELILDILRTTVTTEWVNKLIEQGKIDSGKPWGGDQSLAIFGEPGSGTCQCVITGFHLTVRATSEHEPLAAFGGPISHGHQPSGFYEKVGHPDNIFWHQAVQANEVYKLFDRQQQEQALLKRNLPLFQYQGVFARDTIVPESSWDAPRRESDIRFHRPGAALPGLPVTQMTREQKRGLEQVLASLVEPYRQEYQDQVFACLKKQGGLERCSLAFYQERDLGDDGQWDNWRLEGPSLVWFFRGSPHVHIWIHVAGDRSAPITSYFG